MKISVCMIVKNESKHLVKCLDSVKDADEIIICDTGSTDETVEIAKRYTSKVFTDFVWCDNFAKARNHARMKATGDWIFSLDADHEVLTSMEEIREQARIAERTGHRVAAVYGGTLWRAVFFKNDPKIMWEGDVHEVLNHIATFTSTIQERIGYSDTHAADPHRNLRILHTGLVRDGQAPRRLFYLAREYMDHQRWEEALQWFELYLKKSKWLKEKANAYYCSAICNKHLKKFDEARYCCLMALDIDANFKDACLLMADLSWEHNAKRWRDHAAAATNERVLFTRHGDIPKVANIHRPGAFGDIILTSAVTSQLKQQGFRVNYYTNCPDLTSLLVGVDAVFSSNEWCRRSEGRDWDANFSYAEMDTPALETICASAGVPIGPMALKSFPPRTDGIKYITLQRVTGWSTLKDYPHWDAVLSAMRAQGILWPVIEIDASRPWAESLALIQHAALHLGCDSVGAHIAAAYDVPAVVLWGSTSSRLAGHPTAINLCKGPSACHPCFIEDKFANGYRHGEKCPIGSCIKDITPDEVVKAASLLLQRQENPSVMVDAEIAATRASAAEARERIIKRVRVKPQRVVLLGMHRSGSTLIYNFIRELLGSAITDNDMDYTIPMPPLTKRNLVSHVHDLHPEAIAHIRSGSGIKFLSSKRKLTDALVSYARLTRETTLHGGIQKMKRWIDAFVRVKDRGPCMDYAVTNSQPAAVIKQIAQLLEIAITDEAAQALADKYDKKAMHAKLANLKPDGHGIIEVKNRPQWSDTVFDTQTHFHIDHVTSLDDGPRKVSESDAALIELELGTMARAAGLEI